MKLSLNTLNLGSHSVKNCAVIGIGVSGASCAYQLNQHGVKVELFDKGRQFGGRTSSKINQKMIFNFGEKKKLFQ